MTAKNLSDNPAELAGLIDYQDGAIVSHTLVKNAAGTVTLFAFARGEELSEHTAPYDALI
ncbi:MAG: cupin domain-containing protein, partial [Planctomycetes bacterium]|nr:cupin domain-containing protein [Planctomycetota bacterium]